MTSAGQTEELTGNIFISVRVKLLNEQIHTGLPHSGVGGSEKVPSEMELQFYDDYLVVFRDKHYYSNSVIRREYDKFAYSDIKRIQFRTVTKRINIFGIVEGIWYNYQKDGSLPQTPTYHKTTDSICYFYTDFASNVDFVSEIETHCPVKVTVDNS